MELLCFGNGNLQPTPEQEKQLKYFSSLSEILIPMCQEASIELNLLWFILIMILEFSFKEHFSRMSHSKNLVYLLSRTFAPPAER